MRVRDCGDKTQVAASATRGNVAGGVSIHRGEAGGENHGFAWN